MIQRGWVFYFSSINVVISSLHSEYGASFQNCFNNVIDRFFNKFIKCLRYYHHTFRVKYAYIIFLN